MLSMATNAPVPVQAVNKPIICPPFDEPNDHWVYDTETGEASRAAFALGDWAAGIEERFDLILCNPPYVADGATLGAGVREFEPAEALFAGEAGLDAYRVLGPQLPALLAPGGLAGLEIGFDQAPAVTALLRSPGLLISVANDLAGRSRALLLTWN